jgi:hypothetical protein
MDRGLNAHGKDTTPAAEKINKQYMYIRTPKEKACPAASLIGLVICQPVLNPK